MCATKPGKVIELDRQHMMGLDYTPMLSEVKWLMGVFILRRVESTAAGVGDIWSWIGLRRILRIRLRIWRVPDGGMGTISTT